jgi:molecular chaperone DnaK
MIQQRKPAPGQPVAGVTLRRDLPVASPLAGIRLEHLLAKYELSFLQPALLAAERLPPRQLKDDALFRASVVEAAWRAAPAAYRAADPEGRRWQDLMFAVRDCVFDIGETAVSLRRGWEEALATLLHRARSGATIPTRLGPADPNPAPGSETAAVRGTVAATASPQPTTATSPSAAQADADRPAEPVIGIDLGTTYSVVAHLDGQGRPTSIPNSAGDILTPSVVLFDPDGTIVGKQAVLGAAMEPDRVAECVKRDMGGKHFRKKINGELLPPEVISSYILRALRADAERKLGPVKRAVITVPAYFDEPRRRATMDAGRLAGLTVLDILNEPTAAAICYGYQEGFLDRTGHVKGEKPVRVLVYDLGGGTFDVTIVEMAGQSFKAIATDGDVRLGGKDWDERLIDLGAERFKQQHGADPRSDPESLQELWLAAELAKKTLTERPRAPMIVNHGGKRLKTEVTRREFEEATAPLLLRTRTTTEIVVLSAGLQWSDIDKVLLVGGSTRMPQVAGMLKDLTGKDPDRSISADEAVAHGAALYADLLVQKHGLGAGHTEFTITNVNSHSLGVVGVEPGTGRKVNAILIPKNTALPKAAARRFKTAKANQPNVRIVVVEGESEMPEACTEVGVAVIRDLPPNLPAGWPVEVRFEYAENGRLTVAARLSGHESVVTTEFIRDNSLSDDDLMLWAENLEREAQRQGL